MTHGGEPPREVLRFVQLLEDGEFYEAHEVLEDLWVIEVPPRKDAYKGMIMAAVGLCHWQRGNHAAARRMIDESMRRLRGMPDTLAGIDLAGFLGTLGRLRGMLDLATPPSWRVARERGWRRPTVLPPAD